MDMRRYNWPLGSYAKSQRKMIYGILSAFLCLIILGGPKASYGQLLPTSPMTHRASKSANDSRDVEPPTIIANVSPKPNLYGWNNSNVKVSFTCADLASGIAKCPDPVMIEAETDGTTVSGTAVDKAGNEATTSVIVRVDKTAPVIKQTWPPSDHFNTNYSSIEIEGSLGDKLSGIHHAFIQDHQGKASLPHPDFFIERKLETEIPKGTVSMDHRFTIEVSDFAGNSAKRTSFVHYAKGNVMTPTDPTQTEKVNGILTSINRALIRFEPSLTVENIRSIFREEGGRLAGYLSGSNTALIEFRTRRVEDLNQVLNTIKKKRKEVFEAVPVVFWQPQQFDNDALPSSDAIAYQSVKLPQAETYIQQNFLNDCTRCHINKHAKIAVIDSGLDPSYGRNLEFAKIRFFDLCQIEGQQGQQGAPVDDTGHGTKLTGIIAGANNGYGNNGIVNGLTTADFADITVFRTQCSPSAGGFDGALITAAMEMITSNWFPDVDVVNMSFGLGSATSSDKEWLASFYRPFFLSDRGRQIIWVAPAGNNDRSTACDDFLMFPAGLACELFNVISVGGFDPSSKLRSLLSNYGPAISIYAPGDRAYTATSTGSYGFVGQTSAATAFVTGATALSQAFTSRQPSLFRHVLGNTVQVLSDPILLQGGLDIERLIQQTTIPLLTKETFEGSSAGGQEVILLGDQQMKGLSGFHFNFDNSDHHLRSLSAGSFPLDDLNPNVTMWSRVEYGDWNGDDDYHYRVDLQILPPGTTYQTFSDCDDGLGLNRLIANIGAGRVPVLTGFSFWRNDDDRHIDEIEVWLYTNYGTYLYAELVYQDKEPLDEPFCYQVSYALIPLDRVRAMGTTSGTSGGGSAEESPPLKIPVLQGFKLNFSTGDHHIDEVGVRVERGKAKVWYNDKNDDDDFEWKIWWVDIR